VVAVTELRTWRAKLVLRVPADVTEEVLVAHLQENLHRLTPGTLGAGTEIVGLHADPSSLSADELRALPLNARVEVAADTSRYKRQAVVISRPLEREGHPVLQVEGLGLTSAFDLPDGVRVFPT
jgi:hypothetical protein